MEKLVTALLYPEKIIIQTRNLLHKSSYSIPNFTTLPPDVSDTILGEVILKHLMESEQKVVDSNEITRLWKEFLKKAKFKSQKAYMVDAKMVNVVISDAEIRFEPRENHLLERTFYGIPQEILRVTPIPNEGVIGANVRIAWDKCTFA